MLHDWGVIAAAFGYIGFLFLVASHGDRRSPAGRGRASGLIYPLSLAIYCTSWTFYGAVGRAASSGWDFLPIYLGPVLVFIFGGPLLSRVIRISKRHNITSIADFIGARYGRHQPVAMLVTVIAVIGVLPYIALQLKVSPSVSRCWSACRRMCLTCLDSALAIAVMLAAFAILFGHVIWSAPRTIMGCCSRSPSNRW